MRRNGESLVGAVMRVCRDTLDGQAQLLTSRQLYGPSPAHRMDRLRAEPDERPVPLLRFERMMAGDSPPGGHLDRIVVRLFLARLDREPSPTDLTSGVFWASPEALSALLRGVPFEEVTELPRGVDWWPNPSCPLPPNAFFYMPSEFGERHLARLIAKYGRGVLIGEELTDEPGL